MDATLQNLYTIVSVPARGTSSPTQFLFHRYVNAITDLNFDLALSLAEALVDHAREALYSVPYKDVPLDFRVLYESASLTKTYGILRKWAHLLKGVERDTVEAAKETLTCMREALKALDLALLMSGCPNHKPLVLSLISEIESQISKAHTHLPEPPSQPPSLQPHQSTDHPPITHPIPRLTTPPSLTAFNTHILHSPTPLILQNLITTWPALTTNPWQNTSYLRRLAGSDRTVPVEIGKSYTDDSWSQKLMTFGEFIDQFLTNGDPEEIGYLAQHDLFSQIPQLRNDIITPDYCYVDLPGSESDDVITNAWVGPRGTVSPLHTDPHHNLFAQVVGAKYFRLYSPEETPRLYPFEESMMGNTSQVDIENPDLEEFPEFEKAKYVEGIVESGEVLFIPVRFLLLLLMSPFL